MIIKPIPPILPTPPLLLDKLPLAIAINVLTAFLVVGLAVFLGWTLHKVLVSKKMVTNLPLNLILSGVIGLALFLRFGLTVTLLQGLFLFFVLLYDDSWYEQFRNIQKQVEAMRYWFGKNAGCYGTDYDYDDMWISQDNIRIILIRS